MELVPIFVNESGESIEGLFAVRYEEGRPDEFEKLFDSWGDPNTILSYLLLNEEYLKDDYFENYTDDLLSRKIEAEAREIKRLFLDPRLYENGGKLEQLFKPLHPKDKQFDDAELQVAKVVIDDFENFPQPILRLYGLRIGANTFIVTGGAIKLTHYMENHPDTRDELKKLEQVKRWLIDSGATTQDDINYSYYEQ